MTPDQARELVEWIAKKSQALAFGEIVVKISKHEGTVRFIERTVNERVKV